jgi:hypothetical protein
MPAPGWADRDEAFTIGARNAVPGMPGRGAATRPD